LLTNHHIKHKRRKPYTTAEHNTSALPMDEALPGDQRFSYSSIMGRRTVTPYHTPAAETVEHEDERRPPVRGRATPRRTGEPPQLQYLVQYAGRDPDGNSWAPKWEPAGNIDGDPEEELRRYSKSMSLVQGTLDSTRKHVGQRVAVRDPNGDQDPIDSEAPCEVCGLITHDDRNALVECASCRRLYHQNCLTPPHAKRTKRRVALPRLHV
jgi:hypothetical protein